MKFDEICEYKLEEDDQLSVEQDIWDSEKLKYYNEMLESGTKTNEKSPYYKGIFNFRRKKILYDYSEKEHKEYAQ